MRCNAAEASARSQARTAMVLQTMVLQKLTRRACRKKAVYIHILIAATPAALPLWYISLVLYFSMVYQCGVLGWYISNWCL